VSDSSFAKKMIHIVIKSNVHTANREVVFAMWREVIFLEY